MLLFVLFLRELAYFEKHTCRTLSAERQADVVAAMDSCVGWEAGAGVFGDAGFERGNEGSGAGEET